MTEVVVSPGGNPLVNLCRESNCCMSFLNNNSPKTAVAVGCLPRLFGGVSPRRRPYRLERRRGLESLWRFERGFGYFAHGVAGEGGDVVYVFRDFV